MEEVAAKIVTTPSKHHHQSPHSENLNPNVSRTNKTPSKSSKPAAPNNNNNPIVVRSPQNRIRQRKFLVAKKNRKNDAKTVSCKCKDKGDGAKCLCVAYENLRASQEEFFKNREEEEAKKKACGDDEEEAENALIEASLMIQDLRIHEDANGEDTARIYNSQEEELEGSSNVKRRRDKLLEEARNSVPESGSGRVMHLVKAFEKLLSIPKSKKKDQNEEEEYPKKEDNEYGHDHGDDNTNFKNKSKVMTWALPGLQFEQPHKAPETEVSDSGSGSTSSSSLLCDSDLVLTSENLGLDSRISVSSSWDSSHGRFGFDPP